MEKSNDKLINLFEYMKTMPKDAVDSIVEELCSKLSIGEEFVDDSVYTLNSEEKIVCKSCGSIHVVKNGKDRHGHTRYLCRDCKKTFGKTTDTVVSGTHKSLSVWKSYIASMLAGDSLQGSAAKCEISIPTAFVWRHKILNALNNSSFSNSFNGILEMDELYMRISYKGNHTKSKHFKMPRKPFKRGSDNNAFGYNFQICVLCVAERNKGYSGVVACRGLANANLLSNLFDGKLALDSIVLTDGFAAYKKYFDSINVEHLILKSKTKPHKGKPEVKGPYHINNVNALHHRFRKYLIKYNGVSTKYLGNYLSLFIWLENNKYYDKLDLMCEELSNEDTYISANELAYLPAEPCFAPAA